eukprot:TRINITY_DN9082_c0_g1_i1.p1 TRINITY_DN9082_c0_g1~~TRINITY_DN9082_c0_g1_i1.p1  ORF type:complete len:195 (-),score=21.33 TRINITY_DN9082_c0_g1_i1:23-607(-)
MALDNLLKYEYTTEARVDVDFRYCVFSGSERGNYSPSKLEKESSQIVKHAIEAAIIREKFPKSVIEVNILILEDNGSAVSLAIQSASLALSDASIPMFDLVSSCNAAIYKDKVLIDPDENEIKNQVGYILVACMPSLDSVTQIVQNGEITAEQIMEALELCTDGCSKVHTMMSLHLKKRAGVLIKQTDLSLIHI